LKILQPFVLSSDRLRSQAVAAYQYTGGVSGPLGLPLGPVSLSSTEGRWSLSGGHIVARQDGTNEIVVDQFLRIMFVGFKCFEESGEWSGSDEPYFIVSWAGPGQSATQMFSFESVDKNDVEVSPKVVGQVPVATGVLNVVVREHDQGSRSEARDKVSKAMQTIAAAGAQVAAAYDASSYAAGGDGALTPAAAIAGGLVGGPLGALVVGGIVELAGLADDYVGERGTMLFSKGDYTNPPIKGYLDEDDKEGSEWTHKLPIRGDGGEYDVFLRARIVGAPRPFEED